MFNRRDQAAQSNRDLSQAQIDVGLRSYMHRVYSLMGLGVALTGAIAFLVASNQALAQLFIFSPLKWVFVAVWLGMGFFAGRIFFSNNQALGQIAYWGFCVVGGILTAGIIAPFLWGVVANGLTLLVQAFFIAAAMFLATSLYGYTTKRDLSGLGQFFFMAVIGIIIAGFANFFFFQSGMFGFILSCVTVLLFAGITAYETQQIKHMYRAGMDQGLQDQAAVFGAYMLYGSFIVMFWNILSILGFLNSE